MPQELFDAIVTFYELQVERLTSTHGTSTHAEAVILQHEIETLGNWLVAAKYQGWVLRVEDCFVSNHSENDMFE
jgi:hypothetical protein